MERNGLKWAAEQAEDSPEERLAASEQRREQAKHSPGDEEEESDDTKPPDNDIEGLLATANRIHYMYKLETLRQNEEGKNGEKCNVVVVVCSWLMMMCELKEWADPATTPDFPILKNCIINFMEADDAVSKDNKKEGVELAKRIHKREAAIDLLQREEVAAAAAAKAVAAGAAAAATAGHAAGHAAAAAVAAADAVKHQQRHQKAKALLEKMVKQKKQQDQASTERIIKNLPDQGESREIFKVCQRAKQSALLMF